jgi:hypothetical protein
VTATPMGAAIRTLGVARLTVGLVMIAAAAYCTEALTESAVQTDKIIWGSLALASYAAGWICVVGSREDTGLGLTKWKFGPWILLWYGLTFGVATLTWSQFESSTTAQIASASIIGALWLIAIGMTFWTIGYLTGPGGALRAASARWLGALIGRFSGTVRGRYTPWILYAIGTAGRLGSIATTGQFGYVGDAASAVSTASVYGQILSTLSLFAPLAVSAAAVQVYRQRLRGARVTLVILFSVELVAGAVAGGKESFVVAVLAVVIPMSGARRRLPAYAVIASILIFLVVVIPFNQAYRAAARGGQEFLTPSEAISEAPSILRQTLVGGNVLTVAPESVSYLLQRLQEIDSPAIILQRTPSQIAFISPAQLAEAPLADVIPRAIWHGKPILDAGYQFNREYFGASSATYSSAAITPIGDLYRHGGLVPVIVGMFLLGCGVRLLDDVLDVRQDPQAIFLVLLLFPALVNGEEDWVSLLASMPTAIAVWLLAVALTFRPRESA